MVKPEGGLSKTPLHSNVLQIKKSVNPFWSGEETSLNRKFVSHLIFSVLTEQ